MNPRISRIAFALFVAACPVSAETAHSSHAPAVALLCEMAEATLMSGTDDYSSEVQGNLDSSIPGKKIQIFLSGEEITVKSGNITQIGHASQNTVDQGSPEKLRATWSLTDRELRISLVSTNGGADRSVTIDRYTGDYTEALQIHKGQFVPRDSLTIIEGTCKPLERRIF